jgi:hypothetical protein
VSVPTGPDGRVVAIHQPNFFPWLGYFDKLVRCDAFVLLDSVQFPRKSAGTWVNRVKCLINGEARWMTAPIDRSHHGYKNINEILFDDRQQWREALVRTVHGSYRRAPRFTESMPLLEPLILNPETHLARYNESAIRTLLSALNVDTGKVHVASAMTATGSSNELLIGLTKELDGAAYMCGGGADGYQDDQLFERAGVRVIYQNFQHPKYEQHGGTEFVPGLSIVDALMNLGVGGVRSLLGTG